MWLAEALGFGGIQKQIVQNAGGSVYILLAWLISRLTSSTMKAGHIASDLLFVCCFFFGEKIMEAKFAVSEKRT